MPHWVDRPCAWWEWAPLLVDARTRRGCQEHRRQCVNLWRVPTNLQTMLTTLLAMLASLLSVPTTLLLNAASRAASLKG